MNDDDFDTYDESDDDWGVVIEPACRHALNAFASALTDGRAGDAASLLHPDVTDKHGGVETYARALSQALNGLDATTFRGVIHPAPHNNETMVWGELRVASEGESQASSEGKSIDLMLRNDNGWLIDADPLDARYYPRVDPGEIDHRKLMGFGQFESLSFEPFGLAAWEGPLGVGGSSSEGRNRVTAISLVHGEVYSEHGPKVVVETSPRGSSHHDGVFQLAQLMSPTMQEATRQERRDLQQRQEELVQELHRTGRVALELTIDGEPRAATMLDAGDDHYVAAALVDDRSVTVVGAGVPWSTIALESCPDLERYFEGTVSSMKRMQEASAAALVAELDDGDEDSDPSRPIAIAMIMGPQSDEEEEVVDFCLDLLNRFRKRSPDELAALSSARLVADGVDVYAKRVEAIFQERPVVHAAWADQPRPEDSGRYAATVELLFEGDNPLKRWRTFHFVVEDGAPKLDTDLVDLAAAR